MTRGGRGGGGDAWGAARGGRGHGRGHAPRDRATPRSGNTGRRNAWYRSPRRSAPREGREPRAARGRPRSRENRGPACATLTGARVLGREREIQDASDELLVAPARGRGLAGEARAGRQIGVGIHVDDVEAAALAQAQGDARLAGALDGGPGGLGGPGPPRRRGPGPNREPRCPGRAGGR